MSAKTCNCTKHRAERLLQVWEMTDTEARGVLLGNIALALVNSVKADAKKKAAVRQAVDIYEGRTKLQLGTIWES